MNTIQLQNLNPGERFIIPALSQTMTDLKVEALSEGSISVSGRKRNSLDDGWTAFTDRMACSTEVVLDTATVERIRDIVVGDVDGNDNDVKPVVDLPEGSVTVTSVTSSEGKKRGKKRMNVTLVFPTDKFTIKEVSNASNISPALTYLRVQEFIAAGKIKVVDKIKSATGRGKPTLVYGKTETFE